MIICLPGSTHPSGSISIPEEHTAACHATGSIRTASFITRAGRVYRFGLYLPPCFSDDRGVKLPIIYFVPGRTSTPKTWFDAGLAAVADELIVSGELLPFMIVTTQNIDNRDEMFADTIVNELIPYVESSFPVDPERRHHAVAGGSLGGIAAYRIGLGMPGHFASVAMFGSGIVHGEEARIRELLGAIPENERPRFFLNTGFQDPLMLERARAMLGILDEFGIPHTHIFTSGSHDYAYWAANLPAYLHWTALDW